jgi:hypothetical protein
MSGTPRPNVLLIISLVLIAAATRLLPHPPNFVPVGAMALFGASALPKKWLAFLLPLAAYYLSDLVLNNVFYAEYFDGFYWGANVWIYGGVALMVLFGMGVLRNASFSWGRVWRHVHLLLDVQLRCLDRWNDVPKNNDRPRRLLRCRPSLPSQQPAG